MAYEKYIEELKRKLNAEQAVLAMRQGKVDASQKEVFKLEASIRKYTRKMVIDAKIKALDVPHRVIALAQLTFDRAQEAKHLREGNNHIRYAYFKISALVNDGNLVRSVQEVNRIDRGLRIIKWIDTILRKDMSTKSISLRTSVGVEANRLHELDKEKGALIQSG